jgi:HCOMODA/2-hydroxy-3-carboxy-muconic semialdehyde decarboxylase
MASPSDQNLVEDLIAANHILFDQGVVDAWGHVSVRSNKDKNRYFLSRSIAPALVTAADIMEFDLDSNPIDQRDRKMYFERYIHGEVYKARPDVQAVLHSHSPTVIPFTVTPTPLRALAPVSAFLGAGVPVFEIRGMNKLGDLKIRDPKQGKALAEKLGRNVVVLLRGHGLVAVGNSLRQLVWRGIYTEVAAKQQIFAMQLGEVNYLNAEEQQYGTENVPVDSDRAWDLWKRQALLNVQR